MRALPHPTALPSRTPTSPRVFSSDAAVGPRAIRFDAPIEAKLHHVVYAFGGTVVVICTLGLGAYHELDRKFDKKFDAFDKKFDAYDKKIDAFKDAMEKKIEDAVGRTDRSINDLKVTVASLEHSWEGTKQVVEERNRYASRSEVDNLYRVVSGAPRKFVFTVTEEPVKSGSATAAVAR
ncbi:hypothetical protein JCM10450v2_000763 [Rhodotorula kratochvilovae]